LLSDDFPVEKQHLNGEDQEKNSKKFLEVFLGKVKRPFAPQKTAKNKAYGQ
jgi:hypothetical protein